MTETLDELEARMKRTGRVGEPLLLVIPLLRDALNRLSELEKRQEAYEKTQNQLDAILQVDIPAKKVV